ncbi:hypothetical protein GCM10007103_31760 [Salinimicrobium marinum]|uniref:Uncharacterized protein n=1 Tax=Salinimicrobium marinum TaxID=680283 RepID=A0A918W2D4_9FLAO|nr:hypothetical protein [Salinimicrobium marinum]GHA48519.1 hypothetical protein GCM10007103_31760 [Salinimicrobium marinum]
MNFDNIKDKMDAEPMDNIQVPQRMEGIGSRKMPIQKVRKTMRGEIITQLICIAVFFAVPSFVEMYRLPKSLYYMLMFITSLITLGYLIKMSWFLNKTSNLSAGSKETVVTFIHDLQLTLEVYKTAIIAGSLLLPFSLIIFLLGIEHVDESIFTKFILLDMSPLMLLIGAVGYIVLAVLIYFGTVAWSNSLYGVHIKKLEETLKELEI